jgi:hypothetical protein
MTRVPPHYPVIELTGDEWDFAAKVGLLRMRESANAGRFAHRNETRSARKREFDERLGAAGEFAVAKHLGIAYDGSVNTFHKAPDVGRFDVRTTTRIEDGCLIIRDNDHIERPFVLVLGAGFPGRPLYVAGWMWGYRIAPRHERAPHGHPKAWFVPQSELSPIPQEWRHG